MSLNHFPSWRRVRKIEKAAEVADHFRDLEKGAERAAHAAEHLRDVERGAERTAEAVQKKQRPELTGRGKNHLQPDGTAEGPHTTFRRNQEGHVTNCAQWNPNPRQPVTGFDEVKRVDLTGKSHPNPATGQDVFPPHVHDKTTPGGVRSARRDEIPTPAVAPQRDK